MTLVILTGQIDISVGSVFAICGVTAGWLAKAGLPLPLLVIGTCAAGTALGSINGALVAYARIPSIVATLATMVALRDGLTWTTQGAWVQELPTSFQWLGTSQTLYPFVAGAIAAGIALAFAWGLASLPAGRAIYATGSNQDAARLAGLRTPLVTFSVLATLGCLTGLAALLNSVRFNQIPSNAGLGLEMKVIAAVVVGGAAITRRTRNSRWNVARRRAPGPDRPGVDVPRGQRLLGTCDPGRDHPRRGGLRRGADAADQRTRPWWPRHEPDLLNAEHGGTRQPAERRTRPDRRPGARDRAVLPGRAELRDARQLLRGDASQRGAGSARARADADPHYRRHRSIGRFDDGPGGGDVRRREPRLGPADRRGRHGEPPRRRGRRRVERAARRAARHPLAHRHARDVLVVPRHRGRNHARRRELHGLSGAIPGARSRLPVGSHPGAAPDLPGGTRRLLGAPASFGDRSSAVRDRLHRGGGALLRHPGQAAHRPRVPPVGPRLERRRDRLRRAPRSGAIGRRQRVRAGRNHRGRPRRYVGVRRAGNDCRNRARVVLAVSPPKRPAPGGASVGARRRADRHAAARHDRARPPARDLAAWRIFTGPVFSG